MSVRRVVLPGTFDPITVGHFDLAVRAADLFDEVVILVGENTEKKTLFTPAQRLEIADAAFARDARISVRLCDTTVADAARKLDACCIVKGARSSIDFDYESQIFGAMRALGAPDTVLFCVRAEYADVSSTFVRELFRYHKDYAAFVPVLSVPVLEKLVGY